MRASTHACARMQMCVCVFAYTWLHVFAHVCAHQKFHVPTRNTTMCMHTHTCVRLHTTSHNPLHIGIYVRPQLCACKCIGLLAHEHANTCAHVCLHMCAHKHTSMYGRNHITACAYTCMCAQANARPGLHMDACAYIHIYTYIYIYIYMHMLAHAHAQRICTAASRWLRVDTHVCVIFAKMR